MPSGKAQLILNTQDDGDEGTKAFSTIVPSLKIKPPKRKLRDTSNSLIVPKRQKVEITGRDALKSMLGKLAKSDKAYQEAGFKGDPIIKVEFLYQNGDNGLQFLHDGQSKWLAANTFASDGYMYNLLNHYRINEARGDSFKQISDCLKQVDELHTQRIPKITTAQELVTALTSVGKDSMIIISHDWQHVRFVKPCHTDRNAASGGCCLPTSLRSRLVPKQKSHSHSSPSLLTLASVTENKQMYLAFADKKPDHPVLNAFQRYINKTFEAQNNFTYDGEESATISLPHFKIEYTFKAQDLAGKPKKLGEMQRLFMAIFPNNGSREIRKELRSFLMCVKKLEENIKPKETIENSTAAAKAVATERSKVQK